MKLLVLGGDTPLGVAVLRMLNHQQRHQVQALSLADSAFKRERAAKKVIKRLQPDALLDLRLDAILSNRDHLHDIDIERTRWFGKACARNDIIYLFQSCAWVFSGAEASAPWREVDAPDGAGSLSTMIQASERAVTAMTANSLTLRLAPIYSAAGGTLLVKLLHRFTRGERIAMSDAQYFNPISADDCGRVIAGVLDQLSCGAQSRGVFHYGSNERSSYYEFGEAVFAAASQFMNLASGGVVRSSDASQASGDWCLSSDRIFECFGIHQATWRRMLAPAVQAFYQQQGANQ